MIDVYVFINNKEHLQAYVQKLSFLMMVNDLEMEVRYAESDFNQFVKYLQENRIYDGVLLIDADCDELRPLDPLIKIRELVGLSMMVLMSENPEVALESVHKHLYIADLIEKTGNQAKEVKKVESVLKFCHANLVRSRETNGCPSTFEVDSRTRKLRIPMREIDYIETAHIPHKLLLHTKDETIEFYGKLNEVEARYPDELIRVHRSFVINPHNVRTIDYEARSISFANTRQCSFTISRQELNQYLGQTKNGTSD